VEQDKIDKRTEQWLSATGRRLNLEERRTWSNKIAVVVYRLKNKNARRVQKRDEYMLAA